jgi:hypothetical protein
MVAEIKQLDACSLSSLARPHDANIDLYGLWKVVEWDGDTSDKIAFEFGWRRYEKTILADIEKHALVVLAKGNEDGCVRDNARVEATFARCS